MMEEEKVISIECVEYYCEICNETISDELNKIELKPCGHIFCLQCCNYYIKIENNNNRNISFNQIFCPFRCGTCFNSSSTLPDELLEIVTNLLNLKEIAEKLGIKKLKEDGLMTEELIRTYPNLFNYVMDKYSFYNCDGSCNSIFAINKLCGISAEEDIKDDSKYYCNNCLIFGNNKENNKIELFKYSYNNETKDIKYLYEGNEENLLLQNIELEVLMSIYSDELKIKHPIPEKSGQYCTSFVIRASNTRKKLNNLNQELLIDFSLPYNYPLDASPVIKLNLDKVTLADLSFSQRTNLINIMNNVCKLKLGENCIFDCMQATVSFLLNMDEITSDEIRKHRNHIANNILTLRCPRKGCNAAILDFEGCYALECSVCKCGFCGWCFKDCQNDAHDHVLECKYNTNPGEYFANISCFEEVHAENRKQKVINYLATKVKEMDLPYVKRAIVLDLQDIGIKLTKKDCIYYKNENNK
jgi:hypothetical protein